MDFISALPLESGKCDAMPFVDNGADGGNRILYFWSLCMVVNGTWDGLPSQARRTLQIHNYQKDGYAVTAKLRSWETKGITGNIALLDKRQCCDENASTDKF